MFSGKSSELIRRLERATAEGVEVSGFKSHLDVRHDAVSISSHDGRLFPCTPVRRAGEIPQLAGRATVIGVDEAQFFEAGLIQTCQSLSEAGMRVIVAGLHEDYLGEPFDPLPDLIRVADEATFLTAICAVCGGAAAHTHRVDGNAERVVVGGSESYEPRCSRCFQPPGRSR